MQVNGTPTVEMTPHWHLYLRHWWWRWWHTFDFHIFEIAFMHVCHNKWSFCALVNRKLHKKWIYIDRQKGFVKGKISWNINNICDVWLCGLFLWWWWQKTYANVVPIVAVVPFEFHRCENVSFEFLLVAALGGQHNHFIFQKSKFFSSPFWGHKTNIFVCFIVSSSAGYVSLSHGTSVSFDATQLLWSPLIEFKVKCRAVAIEFSIGFSIDSFTLTT